MTGFSVIKSLKYEWSSTAIINAEAAADPKIIKVENFSNFGSAESELFHVYMLDYVKIWIKDPSQNWFVWFVNSRKATTYDSASNWI